MTRKKLFIGKGSRFLQKIGLKKKVHRGRPQKQERLKILFNIPSHFVKTRKIKKKSLTKRQKKIAFANLSGAGTGFVIGGLTGGLGGILLGVPIGTFTGFTIGRMKAGKPRGRPPKSKRFKSQLLTDLWQTRAEQIKFREKQKRIKNR